MDSATVRRAATALLAVLALGFAAPASGPPEAIATHLSRRIEVDGALQEWDTSHPLEIAAGTQDPRPNAVGAWKGATDASATMFVCWDDERLYFGGTVRDDRLWVNPGELWLGDCIEVFLRVEDARGPGDYQLLLAPLAQEVRWTFARCRGRQGRSDGGFDGIEVAGREVRDEQGAYRGFTFEAAVPFANFPGFEPSGAVVGLNLALVDADAGPEQKSYLVWAGKVLPAYDPAAVAPLRLEGTRSAPAGPAERGFEVGSLAAWKVPAAIVLGTLLVLAALYALRRPLRRLGDVPLRKRFLLAALLAAALVGTRLVPGLVERRREARVADRLASAADAVLLMVDDATRARVLVPGRVVESESPLVRLAEGRLVLPLPEYEYHPLPAMPRAPRRTLGTGTPVRDAPVALDASARAVFRLPRPVEAAALCVVASWREPPEGRTRPPAGAVVGRLTAVAPDGTAETLDLRMGREVDEESSVRSDAHGATESRVAWTSFGGTDPSGPPVSHADEVTWKFAAPRRITALEAEQTAAEGTFTLHGVTALLPGGAPPLPLLLGRTTQEGVPTASWDGAPADEALHLGPAPGRTLIPLDAEADAVFVVYGSPGGHAPEEAGKRVAALRVLLEDGSATAPVPLENGVNLDAERMAGLDHPEDFRGTLAYRWPGPGGAQLHRDSLAIPVAAPPGVKAKALEVEMLGTATRLDLDGVTLARRLQRPPPPGLAAVERRGEGYQRSGSSAAALEGVALTHYRGGRAAATTLPDDLRERVLGTEAPPEAPGRADASLASGVYRRTVGGRPWLARQARLPFRDADELVELAAPAPATADLDLPLTATTWLLLALLLPVLLTASIDALARLSHLRWKLVGAFAIAAVLPLVGLTVVLARHFEEQVDRGMEDELRATAEAAARAVAGRRDDARRMAEESVREESLLRAVELPDEQERAAQVDAAVRGLAARAGGQARISVEVSRTTGERTERRVFPLRETPAAFQDLYEPASGLAYRWSRLVATGVARARTPSGRITLVVEIPVDERVLQDVRHAGGDRAQVLLFSPGGYPVAGTADLAAERRPEAVAARRAVADDLRRAPGEPAVRSRDLGGLPHAVAYDLVRTADGRTAGLLATAIPRQALLAATLGTRDLVLLLGAVAFLVSVAVASLVTRRVAGPVSDLARTARRVEGGDLRARAEPRGRDEIATLAEAFNGMTAQLEGRIGDLSRLNESMATFAATLDRGRVLDLALAALRASAAPAAALVVLSDSARGDLELAAGFRGEESLAPRRFPATGFLSEALKGRARVTAVPPGEAGVEILGGAAEAVVLPFAAGRGRTQGAVVLLGAAPAAGSGLEFFAAIAHQAGIALENARLYRLAVEDPASGLYAGSYFKRRLQEEIDRSTDAGRPTSLVLLGIEGLEPVFARQGPEAGNALLRDAVDRIRGGARPMHLLGRAGRDVVALLLPETAKAGAEEIAAAARAAVERAPFPSGPSGREVRLGATPVAATAPDDAASAEFLESGALKALEQARARRRGGAPAAGAAPGTTGVDLTEAEALGFRSAKSLALLEALQRIAASDIPVLVLGETGAGKEVVADLVHARSRRSGGPLVKVNCAALPGPLLEAELFGYERGAFTGAERRHAGRFEQAQGGTIFLDEIGEMPLELQVKLLRVLQDRRVERLGGTGPLDVDVRLVAASNRDLPAMVEAGTFREDLYFRLNVLSVRVPPLRARREDIPPLAAKFLESAVARHGSGPTAFAPEALDFLFRHPFPGNVRELRNMVERAVVTAHGPLVTPKDLSFGEDREGPRAGGGARPAVAPRPSLADVAHAAAAPAADGPVVPRPSHGEPRAAHGVVHAAPGSTVAALSQRATRLLDAIRARGSLTNRQWCEASGVSTRTGLRDFEELMAAGLVARDGKRRSASYRAR